MELALNLFDLVRRPDRAVRFEGEPSVAETVATGAGAQRAVRVPARSRLRVVDAHELSALWILRADLGWSIHQASSEAAVALPRIQLLAGESAAAVGVAGGARDASSIQLRFRWPQDVVSWSTFDLEIENPSDQPMTLLCGPLINMREHLMPLARGKGVEVGPGLHPHVLPSAEVDVAYVEKEDPRQWLQLYNKRGPKPELPPPAVLDRYRRDSAVALDGVAAGSLDFVFSNHVFEHLANPFQVLANWRRALRPGGSILGVLPDPRFTFDCRQPFTTADEALAEEAIGGHEIARSKYERWCRWTEPRHTPEDLVQRQYSIHVNFFSPESFRLALLVLQERGWFERVFLFEAPNHKDFAFALRCAA